MYGEIYGGIYPKFPPEESVKPVFTQVKYSPNINIEIFDICVKLEGENEKEFYIDYPLMETACK